MSGFLFQEASSLPTVLTTFTAQQRRRVPVVSEAEQRTPVYDCFSSAEK